MKIGGLQPVTLLDYPQKVAAIVFTAGCNMRCPFCYNSNLVLPELMNPDTLYDTGEVLKFLAKRKKYLDGIVITGGEPLVQADLSDFLSSLNEMGYIVKLDTNGAMPDELARLIKDKLIHYIAMDIKAPPEKYSRLFAVDPINIKESIKIISQCGLDHEFRSTIIKSYHDASDVEAMARCVPRGSKYILQNFSKPNRLLDMDFRGGPFTKAEMENMKMICLKLGKSCELR